MNTFALQLFQSTETDRIDEVTLFVGEDASGSFGIQANHARFITVLTMGLARVDRTDGRREFLATSGGLIYFRKNQLVLHTRRYWRGNNYSDMQAILQQKFQAEDASLQQIKSNLTHIEKAMFRRLMELEHQR
ncbi:F0F1 ATP synthase subunit epsilon [Aestuariicella hydrocarbonica]|uniref:F0F1 ATP synthase subunit epsilon n=1 Tax=Pseudomaricurvus hydrocarbonicus TaxID=1470433 RepID=A0A9E5MP40_9GAMM|nr:F0F1 ATP synthase subunit epsilon [Aestuariicella hydrocarbonica]NHO67836.1 F0F1 ATP synthase subunit epsilon [Aestuariicella hydrocarbonica]